MENHKGGIAIKDLIMMGIAAIVLIVGFVCYTNHAKQKAENERIAREKARAEQIERERLERERQQKEEEEFERKKREARLAREKEEAEREAARLAKEKAAREAEEARRLRQEEIDSAKKDYRMSQEMFAKTFSFVTEKQKAKLPYGGDCDGVYRCVFASYVDDHVIYKVSFDRGTVKVVKMTSDALPVDVPESEFRDLYNSKRAAVADGTMVWIKGVKMPGGLYEVPPRDKDLRILETALGKLYAVYAALGMEAPQIDCRVSLKSGDGKTSTVLGVIGMDDIFERDKIEEAISQAIAKKLGKSVGKENIKKKRVKRTVVFYDGLLIKTDAKGVTHVPRVYSFHGTNQHTDSGLRAEREFRAKWEKLRAEAERQEKAEAEAEAEYREALAAAKSKEEAKKRENARNANDEAIIDQELSKCKLLIETRKAK